MMTQERLFTESITEPEGPSAFDLVDPSGLPHEAKWEGAHLRVRRKGKIAAHEPPREWVAVCAWTRDGDGYVVIDRQGARHRCRNINAVTAKGLELCGSQLGLIMAVHHGTRKRGRSQWRATRTST